MESMVRPLQTSWSGLILVLVLTVLAFIAFNDGFSSLCIQTASSQSKQTSPSSLPQTPSAISSPFVGFSSRQKMVDHFKKHGSEFGSITMAQYLQQARELRDRPMTKDVLESVRSDGVISRFDRSSGAFIAFHPDGVIRTFFKPNDGEAYFWRQSRRKHKKGGGS